MKITDRIPGVRIPYEKSDEIAERIILSLNPEGLSPIELWKELTETDPVAAADLIRNCPTDKFYLLYTYYLKEVSHRVFLSDRESAIKFITDNFDESAGDGMDIVISDINFEIVIMGNHDGVLLIPSEQYA